MSLYIRFGGGSGSGSGVATYATFAAFPVSAPNGTLALALDTDILYAYNTTSVSWVVIGGPGGVLSIGALDAQPANAAGAAIAANVLSLQSATASFPGLVNTGVQSFAGAKTFTGAISASNLSGTNTGDVTIGTANGLTLLAQALSLGLSSSTTIGALSATDWNTFNNKQPALGYTAENVANKGVALGYAALDAGGKVPTTQLPSSVMEYQGTWDASTNTPTLADGTGDAGDVYIVSVAGTQNLGSGSITFAVSDWVIYNGAIWQKSSNTNAVNSVNGFVGTVVLTQGNLTETSSSILTIGGGTNAVWGSGTTISVQQSGAATSGYLSTTDWNTFNNKQAALTPGSISTTTTGVTIGSGSASTVGPNVTVNIATASASLTGLLTSTDWNTFNNTSAAAITSLLGDVSATGPGASTATVNSVGGSTAVAVGAATVLANAATDANTASTIVKRDGSGNFSAGTITANLTGNASGSAASFTGSLVGDVTGTQGATSIPVNTITNAKLAQMATLTVKGNNTGGTADALDLTVAQVNAILPVFTSSLNGLVPLSGGGSTNFLRADGTWASPPGAGSVTSVAMTVPAFLSVSGSPITSSGTLAVTLSGTALPVSNGGTGATTLTSNGVLLGNGTSAVSATSAGTAGQVLAVPSAGGAPVFQALNVVTGTRASPTSISAGTAITTVAAVAVQTQFIEGNGGAITMSANPQIAVGTVVGQIYYLIGRNNTNTVTITSSNGVSLNGNATLAADSVLSLMWDGTNWVEISRNF